MAGDWRDDERRRNQNRDRWQQERGWQRDWDSESSRQYGGYGGGRGFGRDEGDWRGQNRSISDDWRDQWTDQGQGNYGSAYGGYGGRDYGRERRDWSEGRNRETNDWRNRSMSDLPGYGWSGAGDYGGGRSYGGRDSDWRRGDQYGAYGEYGQHGGNQERGFWDRASDEVSSWFGDEQAERRRQMDQTQGAHRGRGPKGYMRSDDRIREDVSDALSDDSMVDASEITVSVSNAEVTLSGTVDSRQAKRRAEDCAERISGVKHVQNNLRVNEPMTTTAFGTTGGTSGESTASTLGTTSSTRPKV